MLWNTIVGLLVLAALIGSYRGGYYRAKNGLGLWPFTIGKGGIHREPVIWFALLSLASATVSCTNKYAPAAHGPDTTAVADSDRHDGDHDRDHEKGKKKHPHEDAARP